MTDNQTRGRVNLPLFVIRWLVRRNPWLLADAGKVSRNAMLDLFFIQVEVSGSMTILPEQKVRLLAERDAGTLFKKGSVK